MATDTPTPPANVPAKLDLRRPLPSPRIMADVLHEPARYAEVETLLADTGIAPERFIRTVVHALVKSPQVLERCSGESILVAVLDAARMGLEPTGAYGGGYLIARAGKAVFEVDWRGLIRMAVRSGAISRAETALVYDGDDFRYQRGTDPAIHHIPTLEADRGKVTHCYAIAWLPDGSRIFEVMTLAELNAIMARSSSKTREGVIVGPWATDWGEMARKTTIRRVFKYVADVLNPALGFALEREDEAFAAARDVTPTGDGDAPSRPPTRRAGIVAALSGEEPSEAATEAAGDPIPDGCSGERAPDGGIMHAEPCSVHKEAK